MAARLCGEVDEVGAAVDLDVVDKPSLGAIVPPVLFSGIAPAAPAERPPAVGLFRSTRQTELCSNPSLTRSWVKNRKLVSGSIASRTDP